ncbi:flagellin lysine-N-methylase [Neobacillus massiliamazoniensis]|uniref:Flagellar biosynthetic protein FliU n=1 Tax=Neobacillus massiliamazoniensis TaxID=1499688 RepID=A0A0U1NS97_9BACI|nr:flagellin lysine-N-methylase [Neobacillus massiliamazoniensis]CRK80927.1 Flagellar biosynthetic protein FliU [Neobacillus massiliamazoniensis]
MSKQIQTINKRILLVPQYMRNFSCIGPDCEDSCCFGWRVTIDEATYKKYNRVHDAELSPLFSKKVNRVRSNSNPNNFAKIKMEQNGGCPFLSEEKLCNIQLKLGEGYLSHTCSTYPRTLNLVSGILERSCTMSCPEAARLALLNPNGMEFDEVEEIVHNDSIISNKINTKNKSNTEKIEKYFWELRIFTIQVLQNRSYALWERLILLGMFYKKIEECIQNNQVENIPQQITLYTEVIKQGSLREGLVNIPTQYNIQMKLTKELTDERFRQGINNQRFMDCFNEMIQGIQYVPDGKIEDVMEHYTASCNDYYQPFINEHEYIIENYLVNYVFKNLFPFSGYQSVFDDYVMLVVHYAMIKLHLIGMAGFHKGLNKDLVILLIQSFSKTIEHNSMFLRGIFNLLKDNGFTTMAYMSILIKN